VTVTRILLLGADGQLARELRRELSTLGALVVAGRSIGREHIDFTAPDSVAGVIERVRPHWIVNAAAHTAERTLRSTGLSTSVIWLLRSTPPRPA